MSGNHTPTPWLSYQDEVDAFDDDQVIITTADRIERSIVPCAKVPVDFADEFDAEQRANAAFLVLAVNAYYSFRTALEAVQADAVSIGGRENAISDATRALVDAALSGSKE